MAICANASPLFQENFNAPGKQTICLMAKLLYCLKLLAYGFSPSAFQDYFQMGLTMIWKAFVEFTRIVSTSEDLCQDFFREMMKADARCVTTMHLKEHDIEGMAGSLDCMHVKWKNCPVAWQGQYQGKEGCQTIVMKAFCDFNLWFWHAAFNFPGLLNANFFVG